VLRLPKNLLTVPSMSGFKQRKVRVCRNRSMNVSKQLENEVYAAITELRNMCKGSNVTQGNWQDIGMDRIQAYKLSDSKDS
jgi:hypothetical protein